MNPTDIKLKNIIIKDDIITIFSASGEKICSDSVQNYTLIFYDILTPLIGKNYLEVLLSHPSTSHPFILKAKENEPTFGKLKDFCKYLKKHATVDIVEYRNPLSKKNKYAKWTKGHIKIYRFIATLFIIFGILCLLSIVGWFLGLIALLFSVMLLHIARSAEKYITTKDLTTNIDDRTVNQSVPNSQIQHNTNDSANENSSPSNNLLYDHNHFKYDLFDSFTLKDTGEKWISVYKYENVEIYRPDISFTEIFEYDIVDILPEPDNPYDPNAVAVKFHENILGYLYRGTIQDMVHDFLKRKELIRATVQKIDGTKIYLKMYFCKPRNLALPHQDSFVVKLSGNTNKDMQQNISYCYAGDKIGVDYDYDKEKYSVLCDNLEIGYIPKSHQDSIQVLENKKYEFEGEIIDISENESEKYVVTVKIQPQ